MSYVYIDLTMSIVAVIQIMLWWPTPTIYISLGLLGERAGVHYITNGWNVVCQMHGQRFVYAAGLAVGSTYGVRGLTGKTQCFPFGLMR